MEPKLTHNRLLEVLALDEATGIFTWRVRVSNRIHIGDRAGVVGTSGRRFIMIDGEKFQAHRLAWFYKHAQWPQGDLKQVNGNYDDCSIDNLQPISRIEQARLRSTLSTNTSGVRGVSETPRGKWKAAITANYKQVMLGVFDSKDEAAAIYEYAMAILAPAKTPDECAAALETIIQYRCKNVAWKRLQRSGRRHEWTSFEQFSADVGYMSQEESTVAAIDESRPINATNFRWLDRPRGTFDRSTLEGRAAYAKAWRAANPGRWRHSHLRENYEIDDIEYGAMLNVQLGVCAICGKDETEHRGQEGRSLCVDHDKWRSGPEKVRGLLCGNCNEGIGFLQHDPALLRAAADYMDRYIARDGRLPWSTPSVTEITHLPIGQKILMEAAPYG